MYLTCSALVITILLAVAKILVLHIKVHRSIARLKGDACEKYAGWWTYEFDFKFSMFMLKNSHHI